MASNRNRSLADRLRRWELVLGQRKEILAEIPHLEKELEDLAVANEQVRALMAEQRVHLARYREVTAKIRTAGRRGDNLRGRIGAAIRGRFGFAALDLIRFGFQPTRTGLRAPEEGEAS
jgi:hypothetical protein